LCPEFSQSEGGANRPRVTVQGYGWYDYVFKDVGIFHILLTVAFGLDFLPEL